MSLHCKSTDVPEYNRTQTGEAGTGQMVVRKGYGNECSLMIATRRPGYHTKPHQHESDGFQGIGMSLVQARVD